MLAAAGLRELKRRCCCCSGYVGDVGLVNTPHLSPANTTGTAAPALAASLRAACAPSIRVNLRLVPAAAAFVWAGV